jgi:membrane-associated phospholipid phosphatase
VAPRPVEVSGDDFATWSLRALYGADPPYNCFPSIHVAHSFVSALTIARVHRRLGVVTLVSAGLVALSTLYTKQHYVVDVIAGVLLALAAYALFLRRLPSSQITEADRRVAPLLALGVFAVVSLAIVGYWLLYQIQTV